MTPGTDCTAISCTLVLTKRGTIQHEDIKRIKRKHFCDKDFVFCLWLCFFKLSFEMRLSFTVFLFSERVSKCGIGTQSKQQTALAVSESAFKCLHF